MNKEDLIAVRDFKAIDRNFILATWLRGLYFGDTWFSAIPKSIFMENYHAALEKLLSRPGIIIKMACLKDDPDVILGYAVYRNVPINNTVVTVLDWLFVKSAWRKIGIAKKLLPQTVNACTHLTKLGKNLIREKLPNIIFNPFFI